SSGVWCAVVAEARAGHHYKFIVTGSHGREVLKADPMARRTECPPRDASVIPDDVAPGWNFDWADDDWMARRGAVLSGEAPLRVYEVHASSWRHGVESWDALAEALVEHVLALGFTHVELLPVAEHPYGGSWGYQVTGYFAPTARLGDPDGFRRFVDRLHQAGIGVIVDWVPAHFPKDSWALGRFDGTALYEHDDPRLGEHPDWGTLVFNTSRDEVRNFLVANALYWFDEFHIDGLRVDAVASMLYRDYSRKAGEWIPNERGGNEDLVNVDFLREVNIVVGSTHPGVLMIAEESTAWPGVTAPADAGGLGFTHKWNMGWMHDTLSFSRREPVHRRHHHGELPFTLLYAFSERYVLPLSHDEVVHGKGSLLAKMSGDDWQKFATLRLLYAWQWALPGSPLLFMGSELAPWSEWRHDRPLDWNLIDHEPHRGVHDLVARLNHTVDRHPALWERDDDPTAFEWLEVEDADHSVYALLRWAHEGRSAVAAVANWTPVPRPGYRLGVPWGGEWKVLIDTDSTDLWGSGARGGAVSAMAEEVPWQGRDHSVVFDLPPLAMVWFGADAP
ncbi:MAG: 1,4-alpha-glucan branching protein GlgB, partial [Ilumatobacteraceae bacterium]|nr:1,4-alpha-glucan branching protein GlgB [Ilumatobacteraceae bacterium]